MIIYIIIYIYIYNYHAIIYPEPKQVLILLVGPMCMFINTPHDPKMPVLQLNKLTLFHTFIHEFFQIFKKVKFVAFL